jgi:hypothetical protein
LDLASKLERDYKETMKEKEKVSSSKSNRTFVIMWLVLGAKAEERGEMDLAAKLERDYKETMKEKEKVSSSESNRTFVIMWFWVLKLRSRAAKRLCNSRNVCFFKVSCSVNRQFFLFSTTGTVNSVYFV